MGTQLPYESHQLTDQQKIELTNVKKRLEELLQSRRFNPFLLDEMETVCRAILEQQLSSSLSLVSGWNHVLDLLKDAREEPSGWILSVERVITLLNNLIESH